MPAVENGHLAYAAVVAHAVERTAMAGAGDATGERWAGWQVECRGELVAVGFVDEPTVVDASGPGVVVFGVVGPQFGHATWVRVAIVALACSLQPAGRQIVRVAEYDEVFALVGTDVGDVVMRRRRFCDVCLR